MAIGVLAQLVVSVILKLLQHFHSNNVSWGDLKPANLLILEDCSVKADDLSSVVEFCSNDNKNLYEITLISYQYSDLEF